MEFFSLTVYILHINEAEKMPGISQDTFWVEVFVGPVACLDALEWR
jgi:hypothetical protein